ncbi:MAG TPA: hypothetical protein VGI03_10875 [Verrucomicrobiae bacterium]|jgi:hypothetical protein
MVKFASAIIASAVAFLSLSAQAKDPAAYQIGDVADTDISTPVVLDVIDPQATAALKSSEALKTPAIFEYYSNATNEVATQFVDSFAATRTAFATDLLNTFHQTPLTNGTIASPDFGYFVTAFDAKNKNFPVTATLAQTWAEGRSGSIEENGFLKLLLQAMEQPVRPDGELTFVLGDTAQLFPVKTPNDRPSLDDASRAEIITSASLITLSQARAELRSEFSQDDQLFARAMVEMLKPNCLPDKNLTRTARDRAIAGLVVDDHFDAGQIIVRHGEKIDLKTKAALDELNEKLMPGVLSRQIAAERTQEQQEAEQAQHEKEQAALAQQQQQEAQQQRDLAQTVAQYARDQAAAMREQTLLAQRQEREIHIRNEWLGAACAVISAISLSIIWLALRQRRAIARTVPATAIVARVEKNQPVNPSAIQSVVPSEFAPQLAQAVKEALVQELAAQRREMLSVQQLATTEIADLVRRLDNLQTPLQERLRTYEGQIQQLEKELAVRTEENRELLKMKIEMMRQQLEAERRRVDFN